jgi:hypothetical protein
LSSTNEFFVSTKILHSNTLATDCHNSEVFNLLVSGGSNTQVGALFLDEKIGVLFYTQVNHDGVGFWNSKSKEYTSEYQRLVTFDSETFVFANDLKVDHNGNLWLLTDQVPIFIYRVFYSESINFYIFKAQLRKSVSVVSVNLGTNLSIHFVQFRWSPICKGRNFLFSISSLYILL